MDVTGVRLLGIVPEDEAVIACSNRGLPVILQEHGGAARAYLNIAKRMEGQKVPLMKFR
jgi:septum site-determining protein MinD